MTVLRRHRFVHAGDRHPTFANGSRAAFDGTGTHVARGKNSRQTCFKRRGMAVALLPARRIDHDRPSFYETLFVTQQFVG